MKKINLDTIEVSEFEPIKQREKWYGAQDHSRWIFYDRKNGLFYKIWNDTYVRKDTIPKAFELGFYNEDILPAFVGLIYWEGVCRGYVMKECIKYGLGPDATEFFNKIKTKTEETNLFAYDFCPNHIFTYKNKLTLIDLEGVYDLDEYEQKLNEHHSLGIPGRFVEYEPYEKHINKFIHTALSEESFLNMVVHAGGGGKEIITQNGKLKTVKDIIKFFSSKGNLEYVRKNLNPNNWQYFNCMAAGFRHNVGDHHELGWENMTIDYYNSLPLMLDDEIETFLEENPAEFDIAFIKHSMHRACAMMGRMIAGESYIPFYVRKEVTNPLLNVKYLNTLDWPKSEYTIVQSGILALMGIRQNSDLDIVISSKLKKELTSSDGYVYITPPENVEVMEDRGKFRIFDDITSDDDLVYNYSVNIDGYNFLEPHFYFRRLWPDRQSKVEDQKKIKQFQERGSHLCYPFNKISLNKWGFNLLPRSKND